MNPPNLARSRLFLSVVSLILLSLCFPSVSGQTPSPSPDASQSPNLTEPVGTSRQLQQIEQQKTLPSKSKEMGPGYRGR